MDNLDEIKKKVLQQFNETHKKSISEDQLMMLVDKYPDLDMIYELSELYEVKCDDFVQAKNISLKRGFPSLTTIKWTCYFLNVSIYVGLVINVLVIFLAAILSMMFFGHVILEIPKKL